MSAMTRWLILSAATPAEPQPVEAEDVSPNSAARLDRLADALADVLPRCLWLRPATPEARSAALRALAAPGGIEALLGDDATHRRHVLLVSEQTPRGGLGPAWEVVIVVADSAERGARAIPGDPADGTPGAAPARIVIAPGTSAAGWKRALRGVVGEAPLRAAVVRAFEQFRRREFPARLEARVKYWFSAGDEHVFGGGQARLLEEIQRLGTLREAASALRMSYRHAWGMIRKAEQRLGYPLVVRAHGGRHGGGSALTEQATALLRAYRAFGREAEALARRCHPESSPPLRGADRSRGPLAEDDPGERDQASPT